MLLKIARVRRIKQKVCQSKKKVRMKAKQSRNRKIPKKDVMYNCQASEAVKICPVVLFFLVSSSRDLTILTLAGFVLSVTDLSRRVIVKTFNITAIM